MVINHSSCINLRFEDPGIPESTGGWEPGSGGATVTLPKFLSMELEVGGNLWKIWRSFK